MERKVKRSFMAKKKMKRMCSRWSQRDISSLSLYLSLSLQTPLSVSSVLILKPAPKTHPPSSPSSDIQLYNTASCQS
ncbi:hypothetical protein CROQUDRAFT_394702 [Cronartium quercuum f. sp. fusiforme G11]|uniref:Uncharacterized protein n=1 Tax=Cronartium quercuum f. sp. fusiforme G11 TaxID=708437 RepID=A0A9P6NMB6_9BASI|nr:hypothetical protein CROQUDRAFT_394702 [Cronartium quercuum f. sp. fusiforme G11]